MFPLHEKSRTTIPVFGNKEGMSGAGILHKACLNHHSNPTNILAKSAAKRPTASPNYKGKQEILSPKNFSHLYLEAV